MPSCVLKIKETIQSYIGIRRALVLIRQYVLNHKDITHTKRTENEVRQAVQGFLLSHYLHTGKGQSGSRSEEQ